MTIGCASWNAAFCLEVQSRVAYGRKPKFGVALQFRAGLDAGPVAVSACGDAKRQVGYFLAAFGWARGKASHRGPGFEREECHLSAPYSFGELWAPHGEEHDYGQPALAAVAETGGVATAALPPWDWEDAANSLPPAYRYPRRGSAAVNPRGH